MADKSLAKKRDQMLQRLKERDETRRGVSATSQQETILDLLNQFEHMKASIETKLREQKHNANDLLTQESLIAELQSLKSFAAQQAPLLPNYETKKIQDALQRLDEEFQACRSAAKPKKMFAFKPKPATVENLSSIPTEGVDPSQAALLLKLSAESVPNIASSEQQKQSVEIVPTFSDLQHQTVIVSESENARLVLLDQLTDCTINVFATCANMQLRQLKNCTLIALPTSSSIFVQDCSECTFVVACQQLRTVNIKNCRFYLHVTSRAVIENSTGVGFAPYNLSYVIFEIVV